MNIYTTSLNGIINMNLLLPGFLFRAAWKARFNCISHYAMIYLFSFVRSSPQGPENHTLNTYLEGGFLFIMGFYSKKSVNNFEDKNECGQGKNGEN